MKKIPVNDFVDDLVDRLEENGNAYILIVEDLNGQGARVVFNTDGWITAGDKDIREDIVQLMDETVFKTEEP